jgi:hypothetical protein
MTARSGAPLIVWQSVQLQTIVVSGSASASGPLPWSTETRRASALSRVARSYLDSRRRLNAWCAICRKRVPYWPCKARSGSRTISRFLSSRSYGNAIATLCGALRTGLAYASFRTLPRALKRGHRGFARGWKLWPSSAGSPG